MSFNSINVNININCPIKYFLFLFAFITVYLNVDAVNDSDISYFSQFKNKNTNVRVVKSNIGLHADYTLNFTHIALLDDNNVRQFAYYPNLRGALTLGLRYKIFRISYSFNPFVNERYNQCYGVTDYNKFDVGIKTRVFWLQLYYSRIKGFYYSQEKIMFTSFNYNSVYPQNNDLLSRELGLKANIIFNAGFSMAAAVDYTEIQEESAGSFIFMVNPEISKLSSENTTLIPSIYNSYYSDINDFEKVSFWAMAIGLGYGYSLVLGDVVFSNIAVAGPNAQMYFNDGLKIRIPYDVYLKSSLSYNIDNFYAGVMVNLDIRNNLIGINNISKQLLKFIFKIGLRF